MQKGKHQGGHTQGYPARNYPTYPGNPENPRQYSRVEVPAFHASGTPGGGPGMRAMHHAPPNQPPTPPTSTVDIKQPPAHLPQQAHQMPPQSSGQMMSYAMPGTGRGGTQQTSFYNPPRAPPSSQRIASHARPPVVMSNSAQSFLSQPVVQPVYQGHVLSTQMSGQGPMFVAPQINPSFQIQQQRHQGGAFYPTQPILMPQHTVYHYPQQAMFYSQPLQTISRASGPAPTSQGGGQPQPQPPMALITGHSATMIPNPVSQVKSSRPKKVLEIINPDNGKNILDDMNDNDNTSSRSGESSARQTPQPPVTLIDPNTGRDVINEFKNEISSSKLQGSCERTFPQPNAGQKNDQGVAADFATRVAIAARGDHSGSPNASTHQQSSSRTSNYSESESQASPDPQGMSTPSVSPSKLDTSVESISSENQIVENNIAYDSNQQTPLLPGTWAPVITGGNMPVELLQMPIHPGIMIADDMMRGGPMPNQPAREYQAVQPQWITEGNPVSVIISKEPSAPMESPVRPTPERVTPVVSALAQGPTVEIGPRPQREQSSAPNKGHQQQSPVKRKQRSDQFQEQGDGKVKEQQSKAAAQMKSKSVAPTVENKKQSTQPSQDNDEYVQSVQTKNNEPKTIIIKKNDSDSSGTKTRSNGSLKNKESNNLETRNLNEEIIQDNNNSRNKSENAKCEVPVTKENSPTPAAEEPIGKVAVEETREKVPAVPVPSSEPEVASASAEEGAPSKTNGETTEEEAKSNNQKSKPGNKRPAQSKMRLESKDSRNAEPETPAIEVPSSAAPVPDTKNSASSTAVPNEKLEKAQEDTAAVENDEKELEDFVVVTKNEENSKQSTSMKANDSTNATTAQNKAFLKHNYEAGQWSPLNPEGKKKYDRQFIMDLQNEPQSLRKPTNFPNLELLNDNSKQRPFDRNVINSMNRSHVDALYPSFANKNSSQRGGQAITKRGSQQGKAKAAKPTVVQVSLLQDVKLHETENAWKPARITESSNKSEEEAKTEELYKRVRGILNKLTPEKFEVLVQQVRDLPIDNPTRLKGVIDLVFKKAVDEPSFSVAYAQMCSVLQKMEVPSDGIRPDGKPEPANFRNLLLGRCQQEFEKNTAAELKRDERVREIEEEKDPEKKKALQLSFEEEERKIRMRSVGNIRFIGELYKMSMLTCQIMHSCIGQLLSQGDEESLECLCKLLTTIGQGLESKDKINKASNDKGRGGGGEEKSLNIYFKKLEQIVKNKRSGKVSSRVRFMIQDLIDLRNNKWVPRRNESQPKTIDQIQKEAERENIEMHIALNSHREGSKRQDMRNSLDNRKRGVQDSAGWTLVGSQYQQKSKTFIECDKLKLDQNDVEGISLGSRNQFQWSSGASGGKCEDKRSTSQLSGNIYSLLNSSGFEMKEPAEKDRINSNKSTKDEMGSSKSSSQQVSRSSSRDSASSKRDESRFMGSGKRGSLPPSQPSAPSNEEPKWTPGELIKNSKMILDDYLTSLDPNEVASDLTFTPSRLRDLVPQLCSDAMERRGSEAKRGVGVVMSHFIKRKEMTKEDFLVGLSKVLETADDLAIDMPLVWTYLAEILVDMCAEEVITFKDIASALTPIKGSLSSAKFLAALVALLIETKDATWLEQKWIQSQVKLSDIIHEKDVNEFVKKNKVEFMLIKAELSRMINARASFDEITAWISKNVGDQKSSEPGFMRTLMTVLLEACVTKGQLSSYKLDTDFLSSYEQLILRYASHMEELELPCLFAVQAFVHKLEYPQGILCNIFNHLWDSSLIASESFKSWRDSKDPHEQEGHAVCVTSLRSFFTHLNEPETEDES